MNHTVSAQFWDNYDWPGMAYKVGLAIAILVITWVLAKVAAWLFTKLTERIGFFKREGADGASLGASFGQIASLLVWLFGLVAILQVFALDRVLEPIQSMLNSVMAYLPNLIGAAFVFFIGALIAKIVRQLIETSLGTVHFDQWANRGGVAEVTANTKISKTIATVVWALILIVVAIAALQILGISAISQPAETMLQQIFTAIPKIIAAALILGLGFVISRFAGGLLKNLLEGLGTDRALATMEILPQGKSAATGIVRIAQVGIMLFFGVMATRMLGFPEVTAMLDQILAIGGSVLFGGVIIAAGFLVANFLAKMIGGGTAGTIVKYATLVLFVAMGLRYMGIADSIIELAFGSLVIGCAVAAAIAFGLGGRDAAARTLARMEAPGDHSPRI